MSGYVTKDSGERAQFDSGMQRDTEAGKARFDLLCPLDVPYGDQFLTRVAELMGRGAEKYEDRNWEKANSEAELARMKSSAFRHFMAWIAGETDEDHAAATVFNLLAHETTRFKVDSNALEVEDPLVDEAYVGADHPLLDRLAYWSKRLQRAYAADEHAHKADEIDYAQENLTDLLDLAEDHDWDYVEMPGTLGAWETIGWLDETQRWPYPLPFRPPTPILDSFIAVTPLRDLSAEVSWGDPVVPTLTSRADALERLRSSGMIAREDVPEHLEMTQEEVDALKARCTRETGKTLPDGAVGTYFGIPVKVVEDLPRVNAARWVEDYDAEHPKFSAFHTLDLQPYIKAIDEDIRRFAEAQLGYTWPVTVMCGIQDPQETIDAARAERRRQASEHAWDNVEVFVVDSNGETELRSATSVALQVAFDRRP